MQDLGEPIEMTVWPALGDPGVFVTSGEEHGVFSRLLTTYSSYSVGRDDFKSSLAHSRNEMKVHEQNDDAFGCR